MTTLRKNDSYIKSFLVQVRSNDVNITSVICRYTCFLSLDGLELQKV